jgi:hypothetical protein
LSLQPTVIRPIGRYPRRSLNPRYEEDQGIRASPRWPLAERPDLHVATGFGHYRRRSE